MKILIKFIILYSINEISSSALSGYKLRNIHLKYYLLNTPQNINYSMTQFILRTVFNQWSENCNLSFEFKKPKLPQI